MKTCCAAQALALLAGLAPALAQSPPAAGEQDAITHAPPPLVDPARQLQLSDTQKTAIIDAVRQDGNKTPPAIDFSLAVGSSVPPSIELYILPDRALAQVPDAKTVKYTMVQNDVVLVDPTTMRVVDVLSR
jgi:hypothetical protein